MSLEGSLSQLGGVFRRFQRVQLVGFVLQQLFLILVHFRFLLVQIQGRDLLTLRPSIKCRDEGKMTRYLEY